MTKKGRANGSFFGNHIYENLLARRSHLLHQLLFRQQERLKTVLTNTHEDIVPW